jgi:drug/metabolite transporter (DMT)-like permease
MSRRTKALLMNLGAVLCWSIAPVLIHYVKDWYPVLFQNFFRYLISLIVLWALCLTSLKGRMLSRNIYMAKRLLPYLAVIAIVNYIFQTSFTWGLYLVLPGVGTLVEQTGIIFNVLMAALFFADERRTLRNPVFVGGMVFAALGAILIIVGAEQFGQFEFNFGIILITICAASWAIMGAMIRKFVYRLTPIFATATIFSMVTPLFLITHFVVDGFHPISAPPVIWLLIVISGFVGIGMGHTLYYSAIPVLGLATSAGLNLLIPFLAGLFSYIVFGETFTALQFAGGGALIVGCYLVIRIRFRHIH